MTNSADPDQLASSLFAKTGYPGSVGPRLRVPSVEMGGNYSISELFPMKLYQFPSNYCFILFI